MTVKTKKMKSNRAFNILGCSIHVNMFFLPAMIHAGIGEAKINTVLSCLNIPHVSHSMLDERQRETGAAIERIARKTTEKYVDKELHLTREYDIFISNFFTSKLTL